MEPAGELEVVQPYSGDAQEPKENQPREAKRLVIWRKGNIIKKMEVSESEPIKQEEEYSLLTDKSPLNNGISF